MPPTPLLQLTDTPQPAELAVLGDGLDAFNTEFSGLADRRPLAILLRDPADGTVVGGLGGRTSLGLLFIDLLYLPVAWRGNGLGRRLLQMAEQEAIARGCIAGVLYTISFQAPGFYHRHGWEVFGEVPCLPVGTSRIFLRKSFVAASMGAP